MSVLRQRGSVSRLGTAGATAARKTSAASRKSVLRLVSAVGALVDATIDRTLLSEDRVTSAAEAKQLLAGESDTEELADKIQRVIVLAVPVVRMVARGARFTRVPWVFVATSTVSIGATVRAGVRELQLLSSLVAYRLEQTGAPTDPTLVKKVAIDLYLNPRRTPELDDDKLHLVRLTRKWVFRGAIGRNTTRRAAKAFDAAEALDTRELLERWNQRATP
jgi:hypothetical protein